MEGTAGLPTRDDSHSYGRLRPQANHSRPEGRPKPRLLDLRRTLVPHGTCTAEPEEAVEESDEELSDSSSEEFFEMEDAAEA